MTSIPTHADKAVSRTIPLREAASIHPALTKNTLWRWIRTGRVPATQIGKIFYVNKEEVLHAVARNFDV